MGDWIGPTDAWPQHPKKWWRDALAYARDAGWSYRSYSSHSAGAVTCDPGADARCEKVIFTSGKDGESAAKDLVALVDRCPHVERDRTPSAARHLDLAARHLGHAERLLDAVEALLAADGARAEAEELLGEVERNIEESEALLAAAVEADEQAMEHEERALDLASDVLGSALPAALDPKLLVRTSSELADAAQHELDRVRANRPEKRELLRRLGRVRARVLSLRVAVSSPVGPVSGDER